jgi:dipeptidase
MDLVRLGLERGRTADEAKQVITTHLERYGQGGSAQVDGDRRYHNGFLVADPHTAWVIETCGRHRRVREATAISNLYSIEAEWDEISAGAADFVRERGWAQPVAGARWSFRHAVENPEVRYRAEARLEASCRALAAPGPLSVASLMRHLRDHHEDGTVRRPGRPATDPRGWSVCMHPGPSTSATAAGMIVELSPDPREPLIAWCAMATPCTSLFLPIPFDTPLPAALTRGAGDPDPESAWWAMRRLGDAAAMDPERRTPIVQEAWLAWEAELLARAASDPTSTALLTARVTEMLKRQEALLASLEQAG